jgi:hypothetical protein
MDGQGPTLEPPISQDESLWGLFTDSPIVMMSLRNKAVQSEQWSLAFGCASHGLHNLCKDLLKFDKPKHILAQLVFVVEGRRNVHLLSAVFDRLCIQMLNKLHVLTLFTISRWTTML